MSEIDFEIYQELAGRTSGNREGSWCWQLIVASMGLSGEAGEFIELVKKHVAHGHELDKGKMAKELGDVLWYLAEACSALELSMEDVARWNIEKLKARYPEGFSSEQSINRKV